MKALVYTAPKQVEYLDFDDPSPGNGELLVKISNVGICGSDMHAYLGHDDRRPAPLILGHEASGVIEEGEKKGERVVINPLVTCGECPHCLDGRSNLCPKRQIISMPPRQGAFAEYIAMPPTNLISIPEGLSTTKAALAEPLATAWHAVLTASRHVHRPLAEAKGLVIGAGAVGLGSALSLKAFGCREVSIADTNKLRCETAKKAGIGFVFEPTQEKDINDGIMDVVIDAVGSKDSRKAAVKYAKPGSVIVHVGLLDGVDGFDARRITLQEIVFVGVYTYTMMDFRQTVSAMAEGKLGALDWFEECSLEEGSKAFSNLFKGSTPAAKIVLKPF